MSHATTNAAGSDTVSPAAPAMSEEHRKIKRSLVEAVGTGLGDGGAHPKETDRPAAEQKLSEAYGKLGLTLNEAARGALFTDVMNDLFGLGPIQALLDDPSVTEIMVNRADRVYAERAGKPGRTNVTFDDDAHVRLIIERILLPLGKRLDANNPLADARLPDGSRVNAVIPPVAIAGACLTIRKFSKSRLGLDDLVKFGSVTPAVADFLRACVLGKLNIVVAGGTGSGKTTLLNALSGCIPDHERVVTIEDAAELKLHQDHVITLEAKRPNADGTGEVSIRDLVRIALRMRPERIVVGECRGGEALDMLQAMNTGHDGSLTTLHANSPRDAISRIETMALMAGIEFPIRALREQIGSAVQVIVQQARLRDGSRKITNVTELAGMEGDKIVLQELFKFKEVPGPTVDKVHGSLQASGLRPQFMAKLETTGIRFTAATFTPGAPPVARAAA
ncbi:MAG: putative type secretion system protein [Phycisphaerales bacterium]|nr:putative type secretion system protein [Phycisphaerales bacterium]